MLRYLGFQNLFKIITRRQAHLPQRFEVMCTAVTLDQMNLWIKICHKLWIFRELDSTRLDLTEAGIHLACTSEQRKRSLDQEEEWTEVFGMKASRQG